MKTAADILAVISIVAALLGLGFTVYLLILKRVYKSQLSRMQIETEAADYETQPGAEAPKFAFDWKYDDFDRRFTVRFVAPTIISFSLCALAVLTAIVGMILRWMI